MSDPVTVDASTKGIPFVESALRVDQVADRRWNVLREDVSLPCAVLKRAALAANITRMQAILQEHGLVLCPHGKTTMSPQLLRLQLEGGAWGITAATATHVAAYRHMGVSRVLLANQLVGQQNIRTVVELQNTDPEFEFYCLVDSVPLIEHLSHWASHYLRSATRLNVLLEIGLPAGRSGVRSAEQALTVARAVQKQPSLRLSGVECYEGVVPGEPSETNERRIGDLFAATAQVAESCERDGLLGAGPVIMSAGGSAYVDLAAQALAGVRIERAVRVLRSGCYLTHDDGWLNRHHARALGRTEFVRRLPPPQPAIEIWAYVQSVPEPGRTILAFGKRDVSYDIDLPVPRLWFRPGCHSMPQLLDDGYRITALNDQHAYLDVPRSTPLEIGDMIGLGISHPCTTFDKWRVMFVVDDAYTIVEAINTKF